MTTSRTYTTSTRPIIQQARKPTSSSSSSEDDLVDDSPDSSYERLPPLTTTTTSTHPPPMASSSTLASTTSVNTYDSRLSNDDSHPYDHENNEDDGFFEDTEQKQPVQLLPSDAAIPNVLPVYHLPPINDYPVRFTSPEFFSQLFPTVDRLTVRHDDLTPDGNMNLRIETPPRFILPPELSKPSRQKVPKRPVAFQLFHLRMHDLARREFSLRRYCRDSGREICNSKRAFVIEGQQHHEEEESDDEKPQKSHSPSRPGTSGGSIQRSVSTAFRSVKTPFTRSSTASSILRRPATGPQNRRSSSSGSSSSSSSSGSSFEAASMKSGAFFSTDKLATAPSTAPSTRVRDMAPTAKPVKQATDTIKLEFSNYARVDITRSHSVGEQGVILYVFEWWGHAYAWRRVVDEHTETVSYHLIRDGQGCPVAHIVPEMRGLEEMKRDQEVGGWVPPCHIWISDESVIKAKTDVSDVIMATGLITLVDDSILTRWQAPAPRPQRPIKSYTGEGIIPRHKGLISSIFQRRRSEQYTSRGRPVAAY